MKNNIHTTGVFTSLVKGLATNRYAVLYGGSSSSKTISILQYLVIYALKFPKRRIRITSESIPVMKKSVIRDLKDVVLGDAWVEKNFNKGELIYTFPNGSFIEFVPGDEPSRFKGPRYHISYFDEINHIKEEIYDQADIRTSYRVISSFNPASEFWLKDRFDLPNYFVHHSTVNDNSFAPKSVVEALKSKASTNENFYRVYFLGEWGSLEGLIFEENVNWSLIDSLQPKWDERVIAVDFGFTNDPTSILDIRFNNGELYIKEVAYDTGMLNSDIADYIKRTCPNCEVVCDSAEPKSIEELKLLGINAKKAFKGKGSILNGINIVKEFKINVTKSSVNTIKEFRNYSWDKDKLTGKLLNKPIDEYNHSMDALRYGVDYLLNRKSVVFI